MNPVPIPHPSIGRAAACLAGGLLLTLVAACTPEPPEKERPPEPQARQHTQLRDAMQAPIDRAGRVEADTLKAAAAQREAIEAATGD